jgi:hypothetical protein
MVGWPLRELSQHELAADLNQHILTDRQCILGPGHPPLWPADGAQRAGVVIR